MTEALQRFPIKSPKRVHFAATELRLNGERRHTPQKPIVNSRTFARIKGSSRSPPPPNIPNRLLYTSAISASTINRDTSVPRKSAMKTISPVVAVFPQQQALSEESKKPKKTTKEMEEELKAKIITPSIFSAPQQQVEDSTDEDDEPIEPIVEVKKQTKKSTKKVVNKEPEEELSKQLITPVIFSAPPPVKQEEVEEKESPKNQKRDKSLSKKNSSNATSPSTNKKSKSPVREESVTEKDGITPELIKKVQSLKPLLDNFKTDDSSKNRKNGEKTAVSKKGSNDDKLNSKSKNGSVKSSSSAKSDSVTDSPAAQVVLSGLRSSDVAHNALNFNALQQKELSPPTAAGRKVQGKKL
ncbi:hypothetical protein M3Y97_00136400 [Aphelenchoides bicaudatus]|nr:hypothetical protein M3Y97_00136400 [Aphelenchoides bicaudatus]